MSKYSENMPPDIQDAIGWMYPKILPGSSLLDFGCSTGYFGAYIKEQKDCRVDGVEISEDVVEARKVLDKVYSFDLDGEWPKAIYTRKYNYIFFGDVLEHLKSPEGALAKCIDLLEPDGQVFVSIPNIAHMSTRLELMSGNFEYEPMGILDNTHLKYFTLSSFKKMAAGAGYEVASVDSSTNDFPTKITQKLLASIGLTPSDKFWKMADSLEARAFQYKFVLKPRKKTGTKGPERAAQPIKPASYRDAYVQDLEQKVANLKKHAADQHMLLEQNAATHKELKRTITRLQERSDRIESLLPIRMARRIRRITKKS